MRIGKKLDRAAKRRRKKMKKQASPPIVPHQSDNPIITDDNPIAPSNAAQEQTAPLICTSFSSPTLLSDAEFPTRFHSSTTQNLRASIQANEDLARHRAQQSAAYRARSKYVG
jgi:hypothetical protein